jgi:DNA-binding NtrC family response regulator
MGNPSSSPAATPPVVLVVEVEEAGRDLLKAVLASRGFTVLLAGNGGEALEVYRRLGTSIDLVLMDVQMPELSGPDSHAAPQFICPLLLHDRRHRLTMSRPL